VIGKPLPAALAVPPVIPPVTTGAGHVYVTPARTGTLVVVIVRLDATPLQLVAVSPAVITGIGFTVITTVCVLPVHPLYGGVTV
jgi:hypothetical protein